MAEELDRTEVAGVVIPLTVEDKASPTIKELVKYFSDVAKAKRKAGESDADTLKFLRELVIKLETANPLINGLSKNLLSALDEVQKKLKGPGNLFGNLFRDLFKLDKHEPIKDLHGFLEASASAFVAFKMAMRPGQEWIRFTEQCTKVNFQLSMMASNAGTTVQKLSEFGGAFSAFGGSARDFSQLNSSYLVEMEKRRRGMGTGGKFAEIWRRYGIAYNSAEKPEKYWAKISQWMKDQGTGELADARRLNMKQLAGLNDVQFFAMKNGPEALDRERAFARRYSNTTKLAAEASEKLTISMAHVSQSFQNLKNTIYLNLEKPIRVISGWLVSLSDGISKVLSMFPGLVVLGEVVGGFLALVSSIALFRKGISLLWLMIKYAIGIGGKSAVTKEVVKEVAKQGGKKVGKSVASGAASSAAGGISGAAAGALTNSIGGLTKVARIGAIGSVAGAGVGAVSAGSNLVSMAANMGTADATQRSSSTLSDEIAKDTNVIRNLLMSYVARVTGDRELVTSAFLAARGHYADNGNANLKYALSAPELPSSSAANAAAGSGVVLNGNIEINIDAQNGNAGDIAQKVKETLVSEFRVIAMRDSSEVLV